MRTGSRSVPAEEAWANGSGQDPTTAGVAARRSSHGSPTRPVTGANRDLGGSARRLDPVDEEEPVQAATVAEVALDAVDRLDEAAPVAGGDLGLAVEHPDHGLRCGGVGDGRLEQALGAVVTGHRQASLALRGLAWTQAAARGRDGDERRRRHEPRKAATAHRPPWPLAVSASRSASSSPRLTRTLSSPGPQSTLSTSATDVDAVVAAAAADHVRALGALDLLAFGAADDALAVALRAQVDVLLGAHAQRL